MRPGGDAGGRGVLPAAAEVAERVILVRRAEASSSSSKLCGREGVGLHVAGGRHDGRRGGHLKERRRSDPRVHRAPPGKGRRLVLSCHRRSS